MAAILSARHVMPMSWAAARCWGLRLIRVAVDPEGPGPGTGRIESRTLEWSAGLASPARTRWRRWRRGGDGLRKEWRAARSASKCRAHAPRRWGRGRAHGRHRGRPPPALAVRGGAGCGCKFPRYTPEPPG